MPVVTRPASARLAKTVPRKSWEESLAAYRSRLKACAVFINAHHDLEGLCKGLPSRLAELDRRQGDRLATSGARAMITTASAPPPSSPYS